MVLRDSPYNGNATCSTASDMLRGAEGAESADPGHYRAELVQLVEAARPLMRQ